MSSLNCSAIPLLPEATVLDVITPKALRTFQMGIVDTFTLYDVTRTLDFFLSEREVRSGQLGSGRVGSWPD